MNACAVDDAEDAIVVDGVCGDGSLRVIDVQPLGEEQVDLLDVLFERRVAGGVPVDIVCGAQAFARVQHDVGRLGRSLAMCGQSGFLSGLQGRSCVAQGAVVACLRGEDELGKRLHPQQTHDEDAADDEAAEGEHIEDASEPFPALSLRIVEDRFIHQFAVTGRTAGLGCCPTANRMVWVTTRQRL